MAKRGLDLSPEEAHKLWHIALSGKDNKPTDFGMFVSVISLGKTGFVPGTKPGTDGENKDRRECVAKFLESWAANLRGENG